MGLPEMIQPRWCSPRSPITAAQMLYRTQAAFCTHASGSLFTPLPASPSSVSPKRFPARGPARVHLHLAYHFWCIRNCFKPPMYRDPARRPVISHSHLDALNSDPYIFQRSSFRLLSFSSQLSLLEVRQIVGWFPNSFLLCSLFALPPLPFQIFPSVERYFDDHVPPTHSLTDDHTRIPGIMFNHHGRGSLLRS
jgi:hypothetical protein